MSYIKVRNTHIGSRVNITYLVQDLFLKSNLLPSDILEIVNGCSEHLLTLDEVLDMINELELYD